MTFESMYDLDPVAADDALIESLIDGTVGPSDPDPVVAGLAAIRAHLAEEEAPPSAPALRSTPRSALRPSRRSRSQRAAAVVVGAGVLVVSGVGQAVAGNPAAPLLFVIDHGVQIGQRFADPNASQARNLRLDAGAGAESAEGGEVPPAEQPDPGLHGVQDPSGHAYVPHHHDHAGKSHPGTKKLSNGNAGKAAEPKAPHAGKDSQARGGGDTDQSSPRSEESQTTQPDGQDPTQEPSDDGTDPTGEPSEGETQPTGEPSDGDTQPTGEPSDGDTQPTGEPSDGGTDPTASSTADSNRSADDDGGGDTSADSGAGKSPSAGITSSLTGNLHSLRPGAERSPGPAERAEKSLTEEPAEHWTGDDSGSTPGSGADEPVTPDDDARSSPSAR